MAQPGPPRAYSHPDNVADSMARLSVQPSSGQRPTRPPRTIAELAEIAKAGLGNEAEKGLKHWLRTAETARHEGKRYVEDDDLENAFVEYAKAATIVLERLPFHKDYRVLLNSSQRHNMGLHGQEILDTLGEIKNALVTRYENWHNQASSSSTPASYASESLRTPAPPGGVSPASLASATTVSSSSSSSHGRSSSVVPSPSSGRRDPEDEQRRADSERARARQEEWAREEHRRAAREQEEKRRRMEEQHRAEKEAIARRQREADAAAQRARQAHAPSSSLSMPQPSAQLAMPTALIPSAPSNQSSNQPPFLQLPLESPSRASDSAPRMSRTPFQPPITTTSPPPAHRPIQYPSLMSQHQISQGYSPSELSMFRRPSTQHDTANLLFQGSDSRTGTPLYSNLLPPPSQPASAPPSSSGPSPYRHPPVPPRPAPPQAQQRQPSPVEINGTGRLKTVHFPRESLHRFVSIAAVNTSRNRETCGLLLGKDRGGKYVVTTLLVPRQHSTSDTCTMDEEELVMQFTEERSLITLGWIHTHPTQSCFMSSVDLHTHSGFQRMLPESFAVVCAPKSTPNFGIFRLTDPPGLNIILECTAKEAFHPHPNVPIYTDADRGHVQMLDLSLEIVDLR